jgi:sugar phosphate isomerase/epimerase
MTKQRAYAVDLITFYHHEFWGLSSMGELAEKAAENPRWFWDKVLDSLLEAGFTSMEMTFPPADMGNAIAAYGSAAGFKEELDRRGMTLFSGFFVGLDERWTTEEGRDGIVEDAKVYADFLAAAGGEVMVAGTPLRTTLGADKPVFTDIHVATVVADLANRIGYECFKRGIKLALHTESHSMLWTSRDVDLFMMLADPMYVGLCPDTAHLTLSGSDPVQVVSRHRDRIVTAHWKDALGPAPRDLEITPTVFDDHKPYFCKLGEGIVDWHAFARLMNEIGLPGPTLIELDMAEDPVADAKAARTFVSTALAPLYK